MARLYDEILMIAQEYMGIAAEDYIQRRVRIVQHGRDPALIGTDRLERLAVGIDMTAKGYMSEKKAAEFKAKILALKDRVTESDS